MRDVHRRRSLPAGAGRGPRRCGSAGGPVRRPPHRLGDWHAAEDLMIESFSLLFAKARPIDGTGSFQAYLYQTGRRLALRHQKRRRLFFPLEELPFEPQSGALTETAIGQSEERHQLYATLARLKPDYREALYLIYFEQMSYRAAAQVLGKNEAQITNLVHRGKQRLKTILEQEGYEYDNG